MAPDESFRALASSDRVRAARVLQDVEARRLDPHDGQREVMLSKARFRVVVAGRRWGKTKMAAHEVIRKALEHPNGTIWWVANRWKNTRRGYKEVVKQIPKALLAKEPPVETSNELIIRLKNGASIEFYSGESPDSLAGAGVDFVVVDEAALMRANTWQQLIRPTLMDTDGEALIISTPRGRNYFWELYKRGINEDHPEYAAWQFSQRTNPYIPQAETDEALDALPELVGRQEIMAEFVADAASIFSLERARIVEDFAEPSGVVVLGVDLGQKEDWTVLDAVNEDTRLPVHWERFRSIRWEDQKDRILDTVDELYERGAEHVRVAIDATGVGQPLVEQLEDAGLDVLGIKFSAPWKLAAVKLLAADLDKPDGTPGKAFLVEEQIEEFESYEYSITDRGTYTFEAATGHDDAVSAKLLQHWALAAEGAASVTIVEWSGFEAELPAGTSVASITQTPVEELEPDPVASIMARPGAWT